MDGAFVDVYDFYTFVINSWFFDASTTKSPFTAAGKTTVAVLVRQAVVVIILVRH